MGIFKSRICERKMKTASNQLISFLGSNQTSYIADLYTITLNDGTILKYTSADTNIGTFLTSDIQISRNSLKVIAGVEVDSLALTIIYPPTSNFMRLLQSGAFDGSRVLLQRAIMPTWGDLSLGLITMFSGRISDSEFDRTTAIINVKSDFELLNIQMPKNLYQPACSHSLYGAGCDVVKSSYTTTNTLLSGSSKTSFNTSLSSGSIFEQGVILFTSGANTGVKRTVKSQSSGVVKVILPLPYEPTAGDTFQISQGCDKTKATCQSKFNNVSHFRGFPYVPQPEAFR